MPVVDVPASLSVFFTCDDDDTAGTSGYTRISHLQTPAKLCQFNEDLSIEITGTIMRSGVVELTNTTSGYGNITTFRKAGTNRLVFAYQSGGVEIVTPAGNDDDITLKSADDFYVYLDHDGDSGGANVFSVCDASDKDRFTVVDANSGDREVALLDSSENQLFLATYDTSEGWTKVRVGGARSGTNTARGRVVIRNDGDATTPKPALLTLEDEDGVQWRLWVDTNGVLRIRNADPGNSDTTGTVVGDQT
jgi:hypothetical protein